MKQQLCPDCLKPLKIMGEGSFGCVDCMQILPNKCTLTQMEDTALFNAQVKSMDFMLDKLRSNK